MLNIFFLNIINLHLYFLSFFYSRFRLSRIVKSAAFSLYVFPSLNPISHHSMCSHKGLYHLLQEAKRPFFLCDDALKVVFYCMQYVFRCKRRPNSYPKPFEIGNHRSHGVFVQFTVTQCFLDSVLA